MPTAERPPHQRAAHSGATRCERREASAGHRPRSLVTWGAKPYLLHQPSSCRLQAILSGPTCTMLVLPLTRVA